MTPEELDELFRRGLADQQTPPPPTAWAAIQHRLNAAAPEDEDEALPAFLLRTPAPQPVAPPLMTAARGGAARTAATPGAWYQGPALRAAAAVVLLVGGSALVLRSGLADEVATDAATAVVALITPDAPPVAMPRTLAAPAADAELTATSAVAAAHAAPAAAEAQVGPDLEASPEAPGQPQAVTAAFAVAAAGTEPATAVLRHRAATTAGAPATAGYPAARAASRRGLRPAAGMAPGMVATVPTQRPAADSQAYASRTALATTARPPTTTTSSASAASLTVGEAADAALAAARTAAPAHGFVSVRAADLPRARSFDDNDDDDDNATIEVGGGTVGRLVARATGRPARIASPNALLRRGAGHVLDMIDRADNTADGQLTIETRVVGRPVRKTISL